MNSYERNDETVEKILGMRKKRKKSTNCLTAETYNAIDGRSIKEQAQRKLEQWNKR